MTRLALKALGGAHLNVIEHGDGPAIVALHGFTGSASTWDALADALKASYRIVAIDLPGHGASDSPSDAELYSMQRCLSALAEVLNILDLERVHWLGYSMGGRIALSAAIALPQRTASVILESASPGLVTYAERAARIRDDEHLADWLEAVGVERFVDYWQSIPLWDSQRRLSGEARSRLRTQRLANSAAGLANSLRGIGTGAQPPMHHRLGALSAPALLIAGEDDARYAGIARDMYSAVPNSQICVIPQAGHAVHLEQPEAFHCAVLNFLAQLSDQQSQPINSAKASRQSPR